MKKPKVFANPIDKKINNNREFFDSERNVVDFDINNSYNQNLYIEENDYRNLKVIEKIEKLLNRNGYIFNVDVVIKTSDKNYHTKIAGKINNHLITLDNDVINIDDIIDLEIRS